jgi:hypothetical protein
MCCELLLLVTYPIALFSLGFVLTFVGVVFNYTGPFFQVLITFYNAGWFL